MKITLLIFLFLIIFLLCELNIVKSIDNNLFAIVISTSSTFENFRHSTNVMMFYQYFKKIGIPDYKIILALSEAHTCSPRLKTPGKIYYPDNSYRTCQENLNIDYKEVDFYNFKFLDILRGRYPSSQILSGFRKLNTNENSRIVMYITSHGGDGFIMIRGKSVVLSEDFNKALIEMYNKKRYKEILFILDTCEAYTFYNNVNTDLAPNIYFIASSIKDQKASSINYDPYFMTPLADRFSFLFYNFLEKIQLYANYDINIRDIFEKIQLDPMLNTKIAHDYNINRQVLFKDYFGNKNNYKNTYYKLINNRIPIADKRNVSSILYNTNNSHDMLNIISNINNERLDFFNSYYELSSRNKLFEIEYFSNNNIKTKKTIINFLGYFFNGFFFVLCCILFCFIAANN